MRVVMLRVSPCRFSRWPRTRDLGHIGRTEIVDIELHGLLGILGLDMHVLDRKGHDRSPYRSPAARHDHDIALGFGQRASLSEASADLAVNTAKEQRSYRRLPRQSSVSHD